VKKIINIIESYVDGRRAKLANNLLENLDQKYAVRNLIFSSLEKQKKWVLEALQKHPSDSKENSRKLIIKIFFFLKL
jgi:hypothetical protein